VKAFPAFMDLSGAWAQDQAPARFGARHSHRLTAKPG